MIAGRLGHKSIGSSLFFWAAPDRPMHMMFQLLAYILPFVVASNGIDSSLHLDKRLPSASFSTQR